MSLSALSHSFQMQMIVTDIAVVMRMARMSQGVVLNGDTNVILFKNNSSVSVLCLSFVSIEHLSMWQLWQGGCFEKSLR